MDFIDVDAFCGPRGWDVHAAEVLGAAPWGIELDPNAVATSRAAGLPVLQADIAALDPADFAPVRGFIGSPPCPAFSNAGKGAGRIAVLQADLHAGMRSAARGATREEMDVHRTVVRKHLADVYDDGMDSALSEAEAEARADKDLAGVTLVWEPARWVAALRPRFVVLEQVPPVLELWKTLARELEDLGYMTWVGILSSERYGVPQTRKRAFLLASLDGQPHPPEPTHQAYVPGEPAREQEPDLFGPGLLPWVSMAEALGWTEGAVGFPRLADDGAATEDGYRARDFRDVEEPAFALTDKARSWELRQNNQGKSTSRPVDEPAPTILGGHSFGSRVFTVRTGTNGMKHSRDSANLVPYERPVDAPAPTLDGKVGKSWKVAPEGEHQDPPGVERRARTLRNGTHDHRAERGEDEPAPTLHFGARLNTVTWDIYEGDSSCVLCQHPDHHHDANSFCASCGTGCPAREVDMDPAIGTDSPSAETRGRRVLDRRQTGGDGTPVGPRAEDQPAPTMTAAGLAGGRDVWRDEDDPNATWRVKTGASTKGGTRPGGLERGADEPSRTVDSTTSQWSAERPATTVAGDARVFPPGHKINAEDVAAGRGGQQRSGAGHTDGETPAEAIRVSEREAAILQSFPPDWPFQGTRTAIFQQIGNAVPPVMARAVLAAAAAPTLQAMGHTTT